MEKIKEITQFQFIEKIYNYLLNPDGWIYLGKIPSIILFYSPNDNNSELFSTLEEVAEQGKGKFNVYKVNVNTDKVFSSIFVEDNCTPLIYLCAMKGDPTILKGMISIKHLKEIIDKNLLPKY